MNRFFRTISIIFTAVFALNFMTGCSSLQEVNIESLVYSPEIVEFESRLAFLDAASISKNYEAVDFNKKCMELISDIEKASFNPSLKKAALARLYALEGRTYILGGEMTSKAKKLYEQGMETYKGDVHVIILGSRLGIITSLDEYRETVTSSKLLVLEDAVNFYKNGNYNSAAAKFDEAFLSLDPVYRNAYEGLRNTAWNLRSAENGSSFLTMETMTVSQMLAYTAENTKLLDKWTGGKSLSSQALYKKVKGAGLLSSLNNPKLVLGEEEKVTKLKSARFLWNLLNEYKQTAWNKTKYSMQYRALGKASPVIDVDVDNPDFDAVLGCVENEILNLEDGINFNGEKKVSAVEFAQALKAVK